MFFSRYTYNITGIKWSTDYASLPDRASVELPSYLVDSDAPEEEWDEYVMEALTKKFDAEPLGFYGCHFAH